ncbi:MAG: Type II secretion system protein F [Chlamydiia bacterium]|nr:Type II secretion system protein F [Chlamydiia bacterium]
MPLFRYKVLSNHSFNKYQFVDAENLEEAKKRLAKLQIITTRISPYSSFRKNFTIDQKTLLYLTKDLYYLLHSNLPLYESLITLVDKYKGQKVHSMILDITDCIKHGKPLSSIFREYSKVFSPIYVSIIHSAEKSGLLDKAFLELAEMIESNSKWKKKIKDTLLYPAFLLTFAVVILFGLFLFIIPSMSELFEGRELHPLTSIVLAISNWMITNPNTLIVSFVTFLASIISCIYVEKIKTFFKKSAYKISILKDMMTKIAIVRFTTTLHNLLENTVPILEALSLARGSLSHPYLEEDVDMVISRVKKGEKFSKAIEHSSYFPKIVSKMISTGEHSGSIAPILKHINTLFDEEVKTALEKFTALLQPILLLLIGIIVGIVLLAVLIPLTDVSSLL